MKQSFSYDKTCALCEHSEEIFESQYCICRKKGVTDPGDHCSKFVFDPLKVKVSVRKIPEFKPIEDAFNQK